MTDLAAREAAMWKRIRRDDKIYKIELTLWVIACIPRALATWAWRLIKAPFVLN